MKKILKTTIITLVLLAIATIGLLKLIQVLNEEKAVVNEEAEELERDENTTRSFIYSMPGDATDLVLEGTGKNVLTFERKAVYDVAASNESKKRLDRINERTDPTFEEPTIAYNPFGTNENTFYFYFETSRSLTVRYTITGADRNINDFTRQPYNGGGENLSKKHEFTVGGLVPGAENYIVFELSDGKGTLVGKKIYRFQAKPSRISAPTKLSIVEGKSEKKSTSGLYFLFLKDKNAILSYDNSGNMRGETMLTGVGGDRMIAEGTDLFYAISQNGFAKVNALGQVTGVYGTGEYKMDSGFAYDGYGNLYTVGKKKNKKRLIRISTADASVTTVLTLDRKLNYTDVFIQSDGKLLLYVPDTGEYIQVMGPASASARITGVTGDVNKWKSTNYNKQKAVKAEEASVKTRNDGTVRQQYKGNQVFGDGAAGTYGEYDAHGDALKTFSNAFPLSGVVKLDLKECCFY